MKTNFNLSTMTTRISRSMLALLCMLITLQLNAQSAWQRTFQTSMDNFGFEDDELFGMDLTTDGGMIVAGATPHPVNGDFEILLAKLGPGGATEWIKVFGAADWQRAFAVRQTSDGGYVLAGEGRPGVEKALIIKTDANGDTLWTRAYGETLPIDVRDIIEVSTGGYAIAGATSNYTNSSAVSSDAYLLRLDANGDFVWHNAFGELGNDFARSVAETDDGGFIVAGQYDGSFGVGRDMLLVKTNASGTIEWEKRYNGNNGGNETAYDVIQTLDGGYVMAGETDATGDEHPTLVKTDGAGDLMWAKGYNVSTSSGAYATAVVQDPDSGLTFTGTVDAGFGSEDLVLGQVSRNGTLAWIKGMGGAGGEIGLAIGRYGDGSFGIASNAVGSFGPGSGTGDIIPYLIKTNANGESGGCNTVALTASEESPILTATAITSTRSPASNAIAYALTPDSRTPWDSVLCNIISSIETPYSQTANVQVFPNPATDEVFVRSHETGSTITAIRVYDIQGKLVQSTQQTGQLVRLQLATLPRGAYHLQIHMEKGVVQRQLLLTGSR